MQQYLSTFSLKLKSIFSRCDIYLLGLKQEIQNAYSQDIFWDFQQYPLTEMMMFHELTVHILVKREQDNKILGVHHLHHNA